jgi:hypothetical protein
MKTRLLFLIFIITFSCNKSNKVEDHLNLESKLSGKWIAKAFNGELHEKWDLNTKGWMQQEGYYIENNDTSYAAKTQIQKVGNDIILFSVIKNSNPKIFQLVNKQENRFTFENKDYKNPYQVTYEFLSSKKYKRIIRGYEKDSLVIYEFNFEKVN